MIYPPYPPAMYEFTESTKHAMGTAVYKHFNWFYGYMAFIVSEKEWHTKLDVVVNQLWDEPEKREPFVNTFIAALLTR